MIKSSQDGDLSFTLSYVDSLDCRYDYKVPLSFWGKSWLLLALQFCKVTVVMEFMFSS